MRPLIFV
jgi:hypothetical protein